MSKVSVSLDIEAKNLPRDLGTSGIKSGKFNQFVNPANLFGNLSASSQALSIKRAGQARGIWKQQNLLLSKSHFEADNKQIRTVNLIRVGV